ncbi:MAG: Gfo/Idh/MocA family protein [Bacteroidota bacterium]
MKRREFIKNASLGSAALIAPFQISATATEKKIRIGLIGAGWYGMVVTKSALKTGNVEITAVCDVDSEHLNSSADEIAKLQGKRPKTFKYYKELLEVKDMEAVIIGTPPQWHALQFIAACEKGLDIFCEKPLAYDIREGLAMIEAHKKAGNIVQIGFQRRQSAAFGKAKELIGRGDLGHIHQIDARIHYIPSIRDTAVQAPPTSLDWDEWCGPAPLLGYRPNIGHMAWRLEKEFGNGHLVDWGIHHIDTIRMIMDETIPTEFYTRGGILELKDKITTPDTLTAHLGFKKAPVVWQHRLWGAGDPNREFNNGIFFHGEKASLFVADAKMLKFQGGKEAKSEEIAVENSPMQDIHVAKFVEAVLKKDKKLIDSTPEDAFLSTATVQLAMISYDTGSLVRWDPAANRIIDHPEAAKLMARAYRPKYKRP